jgi:hypothetical protein
LSDQQGLRAVSREGDLVRAEVDFAACCGQAIGFADKVRHERGFGFM